MTEARIQQLREYVTGNGTPRGFVPVRSAEFLVLLHLAESEIRRTPVGLGRRNKIQKQER